MHYLDFTISTDLNTRAFKLEDNSVYDDAIPVRNALIEVTPPGFVAPFVFRVNKKFDLTLNANLLHLNTSGSKTLPNLVDGLYTLKYSVDPNEKVSVVYYYFRNTLQQSYYLKLLSNLHSKKRLLTNREYSKRERELILIGEYILASKFQAEDLLETSEAIEWYNEINLLLKDFEKCQLDKI